MAFYKLVGKQLVEMTADEWLLFEHYTDFVVFSLSDEDNEWAVAVTFTGNDDYVPFVMEVDTPGVEIARELKTYEEAEEVFYDVVSRLERGKKLLAF